MTKRQRINPEDFKNTQELSTYKFLKSRQLKYRYRIEYETEDIPYTIVKHKVYKPDFIITLSNGHKMYIEYKGYLRKDDEAKLLSVLRENPGIDLRIVFQKDNKLVRRKMRYSEWATKHGFDYAIGSVPEEWFELAKKEKASA